MIGPRNTVPLEGLLDTGADDTVFPDNLASFIGLDLSNAPVGQLTTAMLTNAPIRYAQVVLRITEGKEQREWPAWVGFTSAKLQSPLLGLRAFFSFSRPRFVATARKSN